MLSGIFWNPRGTPEAAKTGARMKNQRTTVKDFDALNATDGGRAHLTDSAVPGLTLRATPMNCKDVSSLYCQLQKRISMRRLDHYDEKIGGWQQVLVEDKHAGPADIACVRIDFADWLQTLPSRTRKMAETLSTGEKTSDTAKQFGVSASRISQLRRQLQKSWQEFMGEAVEPLAVGVA